MSRSQKRDVKKLLDAAHAEGTVSAAARSTLAIPDLGAQIQEGLGVSVDDVEAAEVVLVAMMPDDSGSIAAAGNADAVRGGHNQVLDALAASGQAEQLLVHTRYLNGAVLFPYMPVARTVYMDASNYDPIHGTPLYDQTVVLLGTVLAKAQELGDAGVVARTVTLIITDGGDCGSRRAKASHVRALVEDMLATEQHVIAAMGIDDGRTDFRAVFRAMGIPDRWMLTPSSSAAELRRAFQVFSQSALGVSRGALPNAVSLGGFGN